MSSGFVFKVHESVDEKVLAIADKEIIGMTLHDDTLGIDILVSKEFYGEEEGDSEELIDMIKSATNVNIIALEKNRIDKEDVIEIDGIKHAQIYSINY